MVGTRPWVSIATRSRNEEDCSFLKKRTKKLLSVAGRAGIPLGDTEFGATDKSFLLLFFKRGFNSEMHNG
jgi:hypothetical protein